MIAIAGGNVTTVVAAGVAAGTPGSLALDANSLYFADSLAPDGRIVKVTPK